MTSVSEQISDKPFVCELCQKHYSRKFSLSWHISNVHNNEDDKDSFVCAACLKSYRYKSTLQRHILLCHVKNENADIFICAKCNKEFKYKNSLLAHFRTHESKDLIFPCPTCSRTYTSKLRLLEHITKYHEHLSSNEDAAKKYECNICSSKFKSAQLLRSHSIVHSSSHKSRKDVRLKCLNCDAIFSHRLKLTQHYKEIHDISLEFDYLTFSSIKEFEEWKSPIYRSRTSRKTRTGTVKTYSCHRSGNYLDSCAAANKTRLRRLKSKGSKKLQGFCPGEICVEERHSDGQCFVTHQKVHIGHAIDDPEEQRHIYQTAEKKKTIASQTVEQVDHETWLVESFENTDDGVIQIYQVSETEKDGCQYSEPCELPLENYCYQEYQCSCLDSGAKSNMSKHENTVSQFPVRNQISSSSTEILLQIPNESEIPVTVIPEMRASPVETRLRADIISEIDRMFAECKESLKKFVETIEDGQTLTWFCKNLPSIELQFLKPVESFIRAGILESVGVALSDDPGKIVLTN